MACHTRNGKSGLVAVLTKYKNKGFTLVELLVVLTILALLLSLALPRYFNSIEKAKDAALKEELNTVRESLDKWPQQEI